MQGVLLLTFLAGVVAHGTFFCEVIVGAFAFPVRRAIGADVGVVKVNRPCDAACCFTFGEGCPLRFAAKGYDREDERQDQKNNTYNDKNSFLVHVIFYYRGSSNGLHQQKLSVVDLSNQFSIVSS